MVTDWCILQIIFPNNAVNSLALLQFILIIKTTKNNLLAKFIKVLQIE